MPPKRKAANKDDEDTSTNESGRGRGRGRAHRGRGDVRQSEFQQPGAEAGAGTESAQPTE